MAEPNEFKLICPTDFRYPVADLEDFLTEDAFTKYKLKVEIALVKTLAKHGLCPQAAAREIEKATRSVTTKEVYEEMSAKVQPITSIEIKESDMELEPTGSDSYLVTEYHLEGEEWVSGGQGTFEQVTFYPGEYYPEPKDV